MMQVKSAVFSLILQQCFNFLFLVTARVELAQDTVPIHEPDNRNADDAIHLLKSMGKPTRSSWRSAAWAKVRAGPGVDFWNGWPANQRG
jgi:hypothetical protein